MTCFASATSWPSLSHKPARASEIRFLRLGQPGKRIGAYVKEILMPIAAARAGADSLMETFQGDRGAGYAQNIRNIHTLL